MGIQLAVTVTDGGIRQRWRHDRRRSFTETAILGVVYNGKGMSGEREERRTYCEGSRRRGACEGSRRDEACGGGAVLGEADGPSAARIQWRGAA